MLRYRNTRPMWRVLPAFLHYACCGWILHSVFDGGIRRLFVRPADGGCFSVGFNSKAGQLMSIGVHKKYLHLSTCKWTSKILCFPNCLLASQVLRTSLLHWSNLGKPSIFNFLWPSPMDFWRILQRWDAAMPRCPCPSCCLSHLDHVLSRSADSQGPQNPGISSWLWSWLGGLCYDSQRPTQTIRKAFAPTVDLANLATSLGLEWLHLLLFFFLSGAFHPWDSPLHVHPQAIRACGASAGSSTWPQGRGLEMVNSSKDHWIAGKIVRKNQPIWW